MCNHTAAPAADDDLACTLVGCHACLTKTCDM
jgi:hypothetical protein